MADSSEEKKMGERLPSAASFESTGNLATSFPSIGVLPPTTGAVLEQEARAELLRHTAAPEVAALARHLPRFSLYRRIQGTEKETMSQFESVDYWESCSITYKDHLVNRAREPRSLIWFFVFSVGILTAAFAACFVSGLHRMQQLRYIVLDWGLRSFHGKTVETVYGDRDYVGGYWAFLLFATCCILPCILLATLYPPCAGSGTPEVIAYLNGVRQEVGYYGPVVQTGAMISASLLARYRCCEMKFVQYFRNPRDERIIVVVGSAVGLTAAFSAPLGGLVFIMEELTTAFPARLGYYVFTGSLVASFVLQVWFSYFGSFSLRARLSATGYTELFTDAVIYFDTQVAGTQQRPMNVFTYFPAIIIGILCGGAAALFVNIARVSIRWSCALSRKWKYFRCLETFVVAILYATIVYWVAVAGFGTKPSLHTLNAFKGHGCDPLPMQFNISQKASVVHYYGLVYDLCEPANFSGVPTNFTRDTHFHPFASLSFAFADNAAEMLLSWNTGDDLPLVTVLAFLIFYFLFSAWSVDILVSGDALLPSIVIGAAIGRIVGIFTQSIVERAGGNTAWADPGVFAFIGAGAFMAGVTRLSFSVAVILVELTNDFRHIVPLMIAIGIARFIAGQFSHSLAQTYLDARCFPLLDFADEIERFDMFCARDVMVSRNLVIVKSVESVEDLHVIMTKTKHNGFLVESRDHTFKGIALRKQIRLMLWWVATRDRSIDPTYEELRDLDEELNHTGRDEGELPPNLIADYASFPVNLNVIIDASSFCVQEVTCLSRVYHLFQSLGVRHLAVVTKNNLIAGIITRKDLRTERVLRRITEENDRRKFHFVQRSASLGPTATPGYNVATSDATSLPTMTPMALDLGAMSGAGVASAKTHTNCSALSNAGPPEFPSAPPGPAITAVTQPLASGTSANSFAGFAASSAVMFGGGPGCRGQPTGLLPRRRNPAAAVVDELYVDGQALCFSPTHARPASLLGPAMPPGVTHTPPSLIVTPQKKAAAVTPTATAMSLAERRRSGTAPPMQLAPTSSIFTGSAAPQPPITVVAAAAQQTPVDAQQAVAPPATTTTAPSSPIAQQCPQQTPPPPPATTDIINSPPRAAATVVPSGSPPRAGVGTGYPLPPPSVTQAVPASGAPKVIPSAAGRSGGADGQDEAVTAPSPLAASSRRVSNVSMFFASSGNPNSRSNRGPGGGGGGHQEPPPVMGSSVNRRMFYRPEDLAGTPVLASSLARSQQQQQSTAAAAAPGGLLSPTNTLRQRDGAAARPPPPAATAANGATGHAEPEPRGANSDSPHRSSRAVAAAAVVASAASGAPQAATFMATAAAAETSLRKPLAEPTAINLNSGDRVSVGSSASGTTEEGRVTSLGPEVPAAPAAGGPAAVSAATALRVVVAPALEQQEGGERRVASPHPTTPIIASTAPRPVRFTTDAGIPPAGGRPHDDSHGHPSHDNDDPQTPHQDEDAGIIIET